MEDTLPDLSGRIVVLYLHGRRDPDGSVLQDASFQRQGGRLFLVGKIPEGVSANDWVQGIESAVAWDRVEEYLVFGSLEDYRARAARARRDTQVH